MLDTYEMKRGRGQIENIESEKEKCSLGKRTETKRELLFKSLLRYCISFKIYLNILSWGIFVFLLFVLMMWYLGFSWEAI